MDFDGVAFDFGPVGIELVFKLCELCPKVGDGLR